MLLATFWYLPRKDLLMTEVAVVIDYVEVFGSFASLLKGNGSRTI